MIEKENLLQIIFLYMKIIDYIMDIIKKQKKFLVNVRLKIKT